VREYFAKDQVGSSTMPQKRNPWNCEHVKSLWKAFYPRVITFYSDQISEHQRDLTNSASERFVAEFVAGFCAACNRMRSVLKGLNVDRKRMAENLERAAASGSVLAEPAYILLAEAGYTDAHERLRLITLECERDGISLSSALDRHPEERDAMFGRLESLGWEEPGDFFKKPKLYRGKAAEKAQRLGEKWKRIALSYVKKEQTS
jgi:adenylosuccinate lyase